MRSAPDPAPTVHCHPAPFARAAVAGIALLAVLGALACAEAPLAPAVPSGDGGVVPNAVLSPDGSPEMAAAAKACTLTPTPARVDLPASPSAFQIAFKSSCSTARWQILSNPAQLTWANVTSGSAGSGSTFTVRGQVTAHTGSQPRGFTIQVRRANTTTVTTQVDVVQRGFSQPPAATPPTATPPAATPSITVTPSQLSISRAVQTGSFRVTAQPSQCYVVTRPSSASWLSIRGGGHLCGTQTVTFAVTFNTGKPRTAVVAVGTTTVTVAQAGSR